MSTGIPYPVGGTIGDMARTPTKTVKGKAVAQKPARLVDRRAGQEPKADPSTVGGRLVICRTAKNMTQAEAARVIKISQQSMGELERGESKQPASDTLLDMRDKLGYSPDYVIRGKAWRYFRTSKN